MFTVLFTADVGAFLFLAAFWLGICVEVDVEIIMRFEPTTVTRNFSRVYVSPGIYVISCCCYVLDDISLMLNVRRLCVVVIRISLRTGSQRGRKKIRRAKRVGVRAS